MSEEHERAQLAEANSPDIPSGHEWPRLREIQWIPGNHGTQYGRIGKVALFTVGWSVTREDKSRPYDLRTTLPGFGTRGWPCVSVATAQEKAAEVLAQFIRRLTVGRSK